MTHTTVFGIRVLDQLDKGRYDPRANQHVSMRWSNNRQGKQRKSSVHEWIWNVCRTYSFNQYSNGRAGPVNRGRELTFIGCETLDEISEKRHQDPVGDIGIQRAEDLSDFGAVPQTSVISENSSRDEAVVDLGTRLNQMRQLTDDRGLVKEQIRLSDVFTNDVDCQGDIRSTKLRAISIADDYTHSRWPTQSTESSIP